VFRPRPRNLNPCSVRLVLLHSLSGHKLTLKKMPRKLMMMACSPTVMMSTDMKVGFVMRPEKKSYSSLMRREHISLKTCALLICTVIKLRETNTLLVINRRKAQ
jgi:hypothetical protein